jgi:hypothetical protein
MTPDTGDFEVALRQALHAAMDSVQPAEDGLTRILDRLDAPWPVWRVSPLVTGRVAPPRRRSGHAGFRNWLPGLGARSRSALAVAGAVIAVLAVALVLRESVAMISPGTKTGAGSFALAGAGSATSGQGQSPPGNLTGPIPVQGNPLVPGTTPARGGRAVQQPSCAPAKCPRSQAGTSTSGPVVTPSLPTSASQSPAATPTPTPTPTPSQHGHQGHHGHHGHHHPGHYPQPGVIKAGSPQRTAASAGVTA